MSIAGDIFTMIEQDKVLAEKLGLDANNAEQRFNLGLALSQIEGAAHGVKEKPLDEIRKIGFDINQGLVGLGPKALTHFINSGEIAQDALAMDSQALYGPTQLTYIDPRYFEIEHKPLLFRDVFNITHLADPADESYNYTMTRLVGKANFTGEDGTTHYKVDVIEEDETLNIKLIEVEFEITTSDMRAAIKTGRPIEVRKMSAAFRAAEEQMNDAVIIGSDKPKMLGFVKHPEIVEDEVVAGASTSKLWTGKTPEEILIGDIGAVVGTMRATTFNRHSPTDMGLSIERYTYLQQRWIQSVMPISLLKWLEDNVGAYGIERIHAMPELSGVGPGSTEMAIFWDNKPDVIEIDIPMELVWLAPQFEGRKIKFYGEAKISDMILRRKQAARRIYGF